MITHKRAKKGTKCGASPEFAPCPSHRMWFFVNCEDCNKHRPKKIYIPKGIKTVFKEAMMNINLEELLTVVLLREYDGIYLKIQWEDIEDSSKKKELQFDGKR